jgi:hypothetical protein
MRGAIPPLPHTPSWRGAQLNKDNFSFRDTEHIKLGNVCSAERRNNKFIQSLMGSFMTGS